MRPQTPHSRASSKRVAFVVQRCGPEVNGGAEQLCLEVARRLAQNWPVELLTTCALDSKSWANHYSPGIDDRAGVAIRRFPVTVPRDFDSFSRWTLHIRDHRQVTSIAEQEAWMNAQGPVSEHLEEYIRRHRDEYDAFVFFTYIYATTYRVLTLVQDKSVLLPLDDGDWTLQLSLWDRFFTRPRRFIFNTPEEESRVRHRFPDTVLSGHVLGAGVDPPTSLDPEAARKAFQLPEHYLLYVGRIDPMKGCDEMFYHYLVWRETTGDRRPLVLLGRAATAIPDHPAIRALGFVDEQTKWNLLAGCDALIMPSPFESLSMVLLEAWSVGKPVLVNGGCEVMVGQCRRSNGGLWYNNSEEFCVALQWILEKEGDRLGRQGRQYVECHYSWDRIVQGYMDTINQLSAPTAPDAGKSPPRQ